MGKFAIVYFSIGLLFSAAALTVHLRSCPDEWNKDIDAQWMLSAALVWPAIVIAAVLGRPASDPQRLCEYIH